MFNPVPTYFPATLAAVLERIAHDSRIEKEIWKFRFANWQMADIEYILSTATTPYELQLTQELLLSEAVNGIKSSIPAAAVEAEIADVTRLIVAYTIPLLEKFIGDAPKPVKFSQSNPEQKPESPTAASFGISFSRANHIMNILIDPILTEIEDDPVFTSPDYNKFISLTHNEKRYIKSVVDSALYSNAHLTKHIRDPQTVPFNDLSHYN